MSIQVSPEVNAMIFILTGEKLIDADEDLAFDSRVPYSGLGRKLDRLSSLIDKSIHDIGESMPDDLSKSYAQAMGMLVDDGGKNYLKDFAGQLDQIAEGRRKTSMDIMESKWQVIAEIIRLLIEIAIYLAMSFFTGGASASQIMMAKLRSRFFILTTLSHLLQRLHLAPSLTEAFAEAFTTFAVRLAMMNFAPDGRRPDGFDWNDILKSAAFGAAAGFLTSIFDKFAKNIVNSFDNNFLKNGPDLDFKGPPNPKNNPDLDFKNNGPNPTPGGPTPAPKPDPTPTPKPDPTPTPSPSRPDPSPYGNGPGLSGKPPVTFRNNLNLWRNNPILLNPANRPGAVAGHYGLKATTDFVAAGAGEALAEILIKGAFDGDWSTSWSTFVGAGLSSQVESTLTGTALNSGAELRHVIDTMRNQPPTVSGGNSVTDNDSSSRSGTGAGRTGGSSGSDTTGGDGPSAGSSPPVVQSTGQGDFTGSPPPYVAESSPYTSQTPPPYSTVAPPPYTPGSLPVTAAENQLWQQVHNGSAEVRQQALNDIAALRGTPTPGGTEIGVRDGLHGSLSQLPEVRVVPGGNTSAAQIDADEVRRALGGLGAPVTVDPPLAVAPGTQGNSPAPGTVDLAGGPTAGAPQGASPSTSPENAGVGVDVPGNPTVTGEGNPGVAPPDSMAVTSPSPENSVVTSPEDPAVTSPGDSAVTSPEDPAVTSPENSVVTSPGDSAVTSPEHGEGDLASTPDGSAVRNDPTSGATGQEAGTPVPTGGPAASTPAGTAGGARSGGVPTGSAAPSAIAPQATRTPDGVAPADGSRPSPDGSPQTEPSPDAVGAPDAANLPVQADTSDSAPGVTPPAGDPATAPSADGTDTAPPQVSTVGSSSDTGDVRDVSGTADVKTAPAPAGNPESSQAAPLTIVVSEVPPPGEGSPEAVALLDGAGTDRAVVLGPVAPDGAGRPVRAAAELTREGPGAPVRVRPLSGPVAAATADGTTDTAFPGADVLMPLADALGPMPRPTTESGVTAGNTPGVGTPAVSSSTALEKPNPVRTTTAGPDTTSLTAPAPDKLATLSRPWTGTATDLHLESGRSDTDGRGLGGTGAGVGAGRGQGGDGTPPPPPPITPDTRPASPPVAPPPGLIVVRPAAGANGSSRPAGESAITTLDGRTVPLAQLRRLVPDSAAKPRPGRAVQTLTISQSPAEDGTARAEGRRAILGADTFRGVRTTSRVPAGGADTGDVPAAPRTVFTGPPAPLPGSGTELGADYFVQHATPRTVTLGTEDAARPTVKVSGVQFGEVLNSWSQDGPKDRPLVLFSCETGQQPEMAGLPVAQHVANRTGRRVHAPTTEVGTAKDSEGNVRAVLTEGADGPGRWRVFTPEPSGADLDALARDIGLHAGPGPADAFALTRMLQQVRTLREALGPDAEQRPENRELLGGLAFVDGLRWRSPDTAARYGDGRMTPDLLRRMVTDHQGSTGPVGPTGPTTGDPAAGPTAEQYGDFLRAAAELRTTAGPDTTLDALLPPPPPALPPDTMVSPEDVRGLSYAPTAQVTWSLSDSPLPLSELAMSPEDTAELARRRPDLTPSQNRPGSQAESAAEDVTLLSKPAPGTTDTVHADGSAFRRLDTPGGGNCLFRSLLDSVRSHETPPAWAARNVAGLRRLLSDRIRGSELGDAVAMAIPDPVFAVVDDLRMRAVTGVQDPAELDRITRHWNRTAQDILTDGDATAWQRILRDSDYPHLADLAPTPADAQRLGSKGLVASAAELPALWASPFADVLPESLAHTLDLDLRLVQPDLLSSGSTFVNTLNPGGQGGSLHLAYNGRDHFDALVPASAPLTPVPDLDITPDPGSTTTLPDPKPTPDPGSTTTLPDPKPTPDPGSTTTLPDPKPTP
ncbi:hypothetical protein ACFRH6_11050, partial [Streptomyces sp. NPDC056749]